MAGHSAVEMSDEQCFYQKRDPAVSGAERFQPVSIQDTPGRRDPAQYGKCAEGNYQCRTDLYLSERQKIRGISGCLQQPSVERSDLFAESG